MQNANLSDTIAAIATSMGEAGIGIVRLSGNDALRIADQVFYPRHGGRPSDYKTYTLHYGWIKDKKQGVVDEVLLAVMRKPHSYTREDVVEISCHGGIVALRRVLDLVLENGCRLAEPGEFTKRAFLNGRIDLTQAEAVADIIKAKTDLALKVGVQQLNGALKSQIDKLRETVLNRLAVLEANIDFPEEEISQADLKQVSQDLQSVDGSIKHILESSRYGRILSEGIHTVICGKPNVGKSSLLNALLKQERSIVTAIPGTTRDTIEEIIDIKGIPIRIVDTAGILRPRDLIEQKAIERSKRHIDMAGLIILVFDGTHRLSPQDIKLINRLKKKQTIAVINKIDKKQRIDKNKIADNFKYLVEISARDNKNINLLEEAIVNLVLRGKVNQAESLVVTSMRQIDKLAKAQKLIAEAVNSLDNNLSLEFITQDLKDFLQCLDQILGKVYSDDLLEKIFSEFCIGK